MKEKKMQLTTLDEMLDTSYGKRGTPVREAFEKEAQKFIRKEVAKMEKAEKKGKKLYIDLSHLPHNEQKIEKKKETTKITL